MAPAQLARDTTVFTIALKKNDPTAVLSCDRSTNPADVLAGPVVMAGGGLLLFSSRGYALYDASGTLADSNTIPRDGSGLRCAFPLDSTTLLYYRPSPQPTRPVSVYRRRVFDQMSSEIPEVEYRSLGAVHVGGFVNIACNAIFDSRTLRLNLAPQLVGYSALAGGDRWYALDRDANLNSPIILQRADGSGALFSGRFTGEGAPGGRGEAAELRGTAVVDGRRWYVGTWAQADLDLPRCQQRLYICDEAGNVLYGDTLFKQDNADVLLGLSSVDGENTISMVRDVSRLAYAPVTDAGGAIWYGVLDYSACTFAVHRRDYTRYRPFAGQPDLAPAVSRERDISYEPLALACNPAQRTGAEIPAVSFTGPDGARRVAAVADLERDGWLVRVARQSWRDLEAKLARGVPGLPPSVNRLRDSLAAVEGAGCPYVLSLSGPGGFARTFAYAPGERVVCSRVIGVQPDSAVVVRVDLERAAEVLLFRPDGAFVNRFVFNRQHYTDRKDIVVTRPEGTVMEVDYERTAAGVYLAWCPAAGAR
jgi:hypothetical protein